MTQTARQPDTVWSSDYYKGSKARHAEAAAIVKLLTSEPVVLSTLGETLGPRLTNLVRDGDAAAEAAYNALNAERKSLEAETERLKTENAGYREHEARADTLQKQLKDAITKAGIKL